MIHKNIIVVLLYLCTDFYNVVFSFNKMHDEAHHSLKKSGLPKAQLPIHSTEKILLRPPEIKQLININTANEKRLQMLPMIGPKRSAAIIRYRTELPSQQFRSVEELLQIKSISHICFNRIRAYITIENKPEADPIPTDAGS